MNESKRKSLYTGDDSDAYRRPIFRRDNAPRRRGAALLIVLIAVIVAAILAHSYVASQGTSLSVARNIADHSKARYVAESGLELAVEYLRSNQRWRTEQTGGVWVSDHSFGEGSFTIQGQDGLDTNGDGVITVPNEGDGDLTDDDTDPVTLTIVGTVNGATHRLRAVADPCFEKKVLIAVNDPDNLTAEDQARTALLKPWGWTVSYIDNEPDLAAFAAAAEDVNAVYVGADVVYAGKLKDATEKLERGVLIEQQKLVKELKLADSDSKTYSASSIAILQLTDTFEDEFGYPVVEVITHYITRPFNIGALTVCTGAGSLLQHEGTISPAAEILAKMSSDIKPTLLAVDSGGELKPGSPAPGRRVAMPWGGPTFSINSLSEDGRLLLKRALDWCGNTWDGLLPGIAVFDRLEVKGTGLIDSFNSSIGPYGGANVASEATVSTNMLSKDKIVVKDSGVINGNVYLLPEADPSKVVTITGSGTINGTIRQITAGVPIARVVQPVIGSSLGDVTYSVGSVTINNNTEFKKLSLLNSVVLKINGNITILCTDEVKIDGNAQIRLLASSTLDLYTKKRVEIKGSAQINVVSADPSRLTWHLIADKIQTKGDAQMYAVVMGREGKLEVLEGSDFYGTFNGKQCKVENGAFHADTAISGSPSTLGGGFTSGTGVLYEIDWLGPF